jgi:hypothetical protein
MILDEDFKKLLQIMYPEPSDYEYVFKELDPLTFKLI